MWQHFSEHDCPIPDIVIIVWDMIGCFVYVLDKSFNRFLIDMTTIGTLSITE